MTTIRPFELADVGEAGRLLAARHAAHRQAQPLLAARYEDPAVARTEIAEALKGEGASGAVAIDGDRLTGYLLGAPKPSPAWDPMPGSSPPGRRPRTQRPCATCTPRPPPLGSTTAARRITYSRQRMIGRCSTRGIDWASGSSRRTPFGPYPLLPRHHRRRSTSDDPTESISTS